jgi:hypothetical protein
VAALDGSVPASRPPVFTSATPRAGRGRPAPIPLTPTPDLSLAGSGGSDLDGSLLQLAGFDGPRMTGPGGNGHPPPMGTERNYRRRMTGISLTALNGKGIAFLESARASVPES